jgi:hypothetical protein
MASRRRRPSWTTAPGITPDRAAPPRLTTVAIDTTAGLGQPGLHVGDRVTIKGTGPSSGEGGHIERFAGTAIPAAVVRTDSGKVRHVRTIDLVASPAARDQPMDEPGAPPSGRGAT